MLSMLIAYDAEGNVVAWLPHLVRERPDGTPYLVDFSALEAAGEPLRLRADGSGGVWNVPGAVGSGTWPEWINGAAFDFRVETIGEARERRITALVHVGRPASIDEHGEFTAPVPASGHRRGRDAIEAEIARRQAGARALEAEHQERENERAAAAGEKPRRVVVKTDIRDLVGGPDRPLRLDDEGRTLPWRPAIEPSKHLPLVGASDGRR